MSTLTIITTPVRPQPSPKAISINPRSPLAPRKMSKSGHPTSPGQPGSHTSSAAAVSLKGVNGLLSKRSSADISSSPSIRTRLRSLVQEERHVLTDSASSAPARSPRHPFVPQIPALPPSASGKRPSHDVLSRPASPDAPKRARRREPSDFPVLQRDEDGRWQPPSLSKGSLSASNLALFLDDDVRMETLKDRKQGEETLKRNVQDLFTRHRSVSHSAMPSFSDKAATSTTHQHWRLRVSTIYMIGRLSPLIRQPSHSTDQRARLARYAERGLQILERMHKGWPAEWQRSAETLVRNGTGEQVQVIEDRLKHLAISDRTRAKEREAFMDAVRDGVLFCL